MRKRMVTVAPLLLVVVLLLMFVQPVSARHLASPRPLAYDPPEPNEIPMFVLCLSGVTEFWYLEDTGFFVLGGWFAIGWTEADAAFKRAFMSRATTTEFFVDDVQQGTSMWTRHAKTFTFLGDTLEDVKLKQVIWENHNGLSGTHVLTGMWFEDASFTGGPFREAVLVLECDLTVHFG